MDTKEKDVLQERTPTVTIDASIISNAAHTVDKPSKEEAAFVVQYEEEVNVIPQHKSYEEIEKDIPYYIKGHKRNIFHALPGELREYILKTAKQIDAPEEIIFMSILAASSAAAGNSLKLKLKPSWIEKAIFFCGVIAEASSGKTPATKAALKPLINHQLHLKKQYDQDMLQYEQNKADFEAHKKEKNQKGTKPSQLVPTPKKPPFSQVIVQDATIESLREVFMYNTRGILLYADEMSGWLNSLNQYKGGKGNDKQQWLEIYNGGMLTYNRVGKEPLIIEEPFISIIGGIQTEIAHKLLNADNEADGFSARFLFVKPETNVIRSSFLEEVEGYEAYAKHYELIINVLLSISSNTEPLVFTEDAKTYFALKNDELKEKQRNAATANTWRAVYGKLNTYAARLCIVLHALTYANNKILYKNGHLQEEPILNEIDIQTVVNVWEYLIPYFEEELKAIYKEQELTVDEKTIKVILEKFDGFLNKEKVFLTKDEHKAVLFSDLYNSQPFGRQSKSKTKMDLEGFALRNPHFCKIETCIPEGKNRNGTYFILNKNYVPEFEI